VHEKVNLRLILYGLEYDKLEKNFILFKIKYTEQKAIIDAIKYHEDPKRDP